MLIDANGNKYEGRAHLGDAGHDLRSDGEYVLAPGERALIGTGVWVEEGALHGGVGLLFGRSGLGTRGVTLANSVGVIDYGYRGEIKANLINHGSETFRISKGDRIAQFVAVSLMDWLDEGAERGKGGHGSSGR